VGLKVKAIIVAFGILETSTDLISDLQKNFEVNTYQYLSVVENALNYVAKNQEVELHITSSILADFSRDSVFAYSLSKQNMEKSLKYLLRSRNLKMLKIYCWKLAYVDTNLNKSRTKSIIYTTLKVVENISANTKMPGTYYLPKIAKFPSKILGYFPAIAAKLN
jgi:hypothetical protein